MTIILVSEFIYSLTTAEWIFMYPNSLLKDQPHPYLRVKLSRILENYSLYCQNNLHEFQGTYDGRFIHARK